MSGLVLIVSADDYGLTPEVNRGIEHAHREGVVTSTSILVNQPAADEAATLRDRCPGLGVGVHVTLTLGPPSAEPRQVRALLDGDGLLLPLAALLGRVRSGKVPPQQIVDEAVAQVVRLRELGVEPDHWDAHQHVQEYRQLTGPIAEAMRLAGVRRTRNPRRVVAGAARRSPVRRLQARRRRPGARAIAEAFATPDWLLDGDPAGWESAIARLPDGVVEAVCHPSEPCPALERLTPALSAERYRELGVLLGPSLRAAIERRHARLAAFDVLTPALLA